jgi:hypothetical protein
MKLTFLYDINKLGLNNSMGRILELATNNVRRIQFLMIALLFFSYNVEAQIDSLNIQLIGINKGEKYKFISNGKVFYKVKCNGLNRVNDFLFPIQNLKENATLDLFVYRKGRFGLFYRNTEACFIFKPQFKYLVIYRNKRLKNRYALDYEWSNNRMMLE